MICLYVCPSYPANLTTLSLGRNLDGLVRTSLVSRGWVAPNHSFSQEAWAIPYSAQGLEIIYPGWGFWSSQGLKAPGRAGPGDRVPCVFPEQIMTTLLQLLLGLSLGCTGAGGFVAHVESTCLLDDNGTPQDFTYCVSFNKDLLTCWDPKEGQMAPCEFGTLNMLATYLSDYLNKQKGLLQRLSEGLQDCATHTKPFWGSLTHRTRPPSVQVAKTTPFNTREPVMLACYVSGFYPADVTITWRKNGQLVPPHGSAHKIAQPNGDWTYQTLSHLATTPSFWDTYTCVVEHIGSPEPIRQDWTPGLSPAQTAKVSVSAVTLGLGLIIFSLGLLRCRRAGSSGYTSLPGANYPEGRHIS